ncbi:MAG: hypothetical protein ACRYFX_31905 [Janthinobacterium lividum]
MAELRIQPKKSAPSPWLLVGLAVLLLAAAAYFFLRPDPAATPAPVATAPAPADSLAPGSPAAQARATPPPPADSVPAANDPAVSPAYSGSGLAALGTDLLRLTDRADLRDDAAIREQRDNFTSATARLADGDAQASLRPGLVAAATLLAAVQQKAYPDLAPQAADLLRQANELSGRAATPADQASNHAWVDQASALLQAMSQPAGRTI